MGSRGTEQTDLANRRSRWGFALLASGLIVAGAVAVLGPSFSELVGGGIAVAALLVFGVGLTQLWLVARVIGRMAQVAVIVLVLALVCLLASPMLTASGIPAVSSAAAAAASVTMAGGFALLVVAALLLLVAWARAGAHDMLVASPRSTDAAPSSRRSRLITASVIFGALLLVVAVGIVVELVWNPLAMGPGYTLSEIYGMLPAGEGAFGIASVLTWAGIVVVVAAGQLISVVLAARRGGASVPRRHQVVIALLTGSIAVFLLFFFAFGLGNTISDTVPPMVGRSSAEGVLYGLLTPLGLIGALLVSAGPWPRNERRKLEASAAR
ncbi:hypothetical protein [Orlajensenia leifsoniae]|uniref:Uncharacterized protein n=1 Tax=Orlajensenia leifsoniae TaxID=2561933 RepID=A0A4Y9QMX7_9MICO|nr:hypothetical protein [Leifsonia flava]TFV94044.1 hypothetical protein E4M00_17345 [Leifsonia flava]